jgi:hypothetical protein
MLMLYINTYCGIYNITIMLIHTSKCCVNDLKASFDLEHRLNFFEVMMIDFAVRVSGFKKLV